MRVALALVLVAACGTPPGGGTIDASGSTGDPYAMTRAKCIAKINALRATKSLAPYTEWTSAPETCVDNEATKDEMANSPHHTWSTGNDSCKGNGQNECLGQGVAGIESCLDSMWNEKNQPGCAGCDACASAYTPNCANCDFYGTQTGNTCGHYVNMSAKYFTMAACGFSSLGGWDAINFQ